MKNDNCWRRGRCYIEEDGACNDDCVVYRWLSRAIRDSWMPQNLTSATLALIPDEIDVTTFIKLQKIGEQIVDFVEKGGSLLIYSPRTGNGKTTWACKLGVRYINKIKDGNYENRVTFVNVSDFLYKHRQETINGYEYNMERTLKRLTESDLVIWDDLVAEKLSDYDTTILLGILNSRVANNKANIFTTNTSVEVNKNTKELQFVGNMDRRLQDRIINYSILVGLKGLSNRQPIKLEGIN